jgi:pilus assembly protein CpaB
MMARTRALLAAHRNTVLFAAALACGAVAVFAGKEYLAQQLEAERVRLSPKPARSVDVIVARHDLGKGDEVSARTMAVRRIPEEFASSSAIRPERFEGFNGMRLAVALRGGEQLLAAAIVGGETMTFSHRVKPGIRALTIAVDEVNSISGMLQPGDRIDLLFSARPPGDVPGQQQAPEATVPLFQSLVVLATGKQVRAGTDERGGQRTFSTVTVEVEPEHAQRLVVAQRAGKLTAVLRNPDDPQRMVRKAMDIRQLLEVPTGAVAPSVPPQVIVGGLGRVPPYPQALEAAAPSVLSAGLVPEPSAAAMRAPSTATSAGFVLPVPGAAADDAQEPAPMPPPNRVRRAGRVGSDAPRPSR